MFIQFSFTRFRKRVRSIYSDATKSILMKVILNREISSTCANQNFSFN
jgi:hypothetical protein